MTTFDTTGAGKKRTEAQERDNGVGRRLTSPLGRLYAAAGRHLALEQSGNGTPSVVVLPGAGMVGLDFLNIHQQVSQLTTSVLYDRAGTGWSDQTVLPRSAADVTDELRNLLQVAGVSAPYLLVGHSLGGAYAQRYAQRFPAEVCGMLLLEPACEDFDAHMPKQSLLEQIQGILASLGLLLHYKSFYRGMYTRAFAEWPSAVRDPLIEWHMRNLTKTFHEWPASDRTGKGRLMTELRQGGRLPDVPMIVLCALGMDPSMAQIMSRSYLHRMNDGKRIVYTALAHSVPRGEYRELENAGHSFMHIDRPDAIVQAIRDLLSRM
jgi:pimeloyl-ACP methyl ester carboxylesterase